LVKISNCLKVILVISILLTSAWALGCTSPEVSPGTNITNASTTVGPMRQYTMATGGTSGTYYPVGGGIANTVNNASLGFQITPESTQASVANCRFVQSKTDDFAIVQNDVAYAAINGQQDFASEGNLTNIEGVASLYPETIQCYALKSSGINSIADLKGKRVVVGDKGSGSEFNALQILAAYGLTKDDVIEDYSKISGASDLIKNGQADAAFFTGGAPTAGISDLAYSNPIVIVPIAGAEREALMNMSPFYAKDTIKAGTYPGVDQDVETVSVMAMIIVNKDVPQDDVYNLLKAIYEPDSLLRKSHARVANITPADGLKGMSIPLNPGAKKYFDELGITQ
jgi:TRAP transporter TAXI family solute receptor